VRGRRARREAAARRAERAAAADPEYDEDEEYDEEFGDLGFEDELPRAASRRSSGGSARAASRGSLGSFGRRSSGGSARASSRRSSGGARRASPKPVPPPRKRSSERRTDLKHALHAVLKQNHPTLRIREVALQGVQDMLTDVAHRLGHEAEYLMKSAGKQTLTPREIQSAVRLVFCGELVKHAVAEGTKAFTKLDSGGGKAGTSRGQRAGLQVQPARALRLLQEHSTLGKYRTGALADVYAAAVLEYLGAEILELAGNAARDANSKSVRSRDIAMAVCNDEDLLKMFPELAIYASRKKPGVATCAMTTGVLPALLPKKKQAAM